MGVNLFLFPLLEQKMKIKKNGSVITITELGKEHGYRITIPVERIINIISTESGLNIILRKKNDTTKVSKTVIYCSDAEKEIIIQHIESVKASIRSL